MFPGSNLNSNAKLCFLLLIWIQFQSFFKIVIPTHIQSFTPEFLFEFELKASFSNCYSYSNSNLKFSLRIPMFEFFFYALFPNTYLNWNTKSGFSNFYLNPKSLVYQLLFLFEFRSEDLFPNSYWNSFSYKNSETKLRIQIWIRVRETNFE